MPYSLKGKCVYKGSEVLKCHETEAKALAHFRALKINVKDSAVAELSMYISKVSVDKGAGGVMRWRGTASDIDYDLYSERMSNELYDDFINRINTDQKVPETFRSALGEDEWDGGMPYVSLSHYKTGKGHKNVPGMPEKVYRDGDKLKAVGTLYDTPIGRATFKSLLDDLYSEKSKHEGKIRISIGFLDLQHKHTGEGKTPDFVFTRSSLEDKCPMCQKGIGNKVYTKGQLVHLALTRVPVNPRTDVEVSKSMIETKKEDAESIVGKELSDTLEEKSLVSDLLVTKSEEAEVVAEKSEVAPEPVAEVVVEEKAKIASDKKDEELTYDEPDEEKREERRNRPAGERSLLQKSVDAIENKIVEMKSLNIPAEAMLREVQPLYTELGEVIKKSVQPDAVQVQAIISNELSELTQIVKSLAESVNEMRQNVTVEIATLKAQTLTAKPKVGEVPVPRSLNAGSIPATQPSRKLTQIEELAYKSTLAR